FFGRITIALAHRIQGFVADQSQGFYHFLLELGSDIIVNLLVKNTREIIRWSNSFFMKSLDDMRMLDFVQQLYDLIIVRLERISKFFHRIGENPLVGEGKATICIEPYDMWLEQISQIRMFAKGIYQSIRSEEHTSELQSRENLVCRLL